MSSKILVIDDEASIRELLSLEFQDLGYEVTSLPDAIQGLRFLKENSMDLVILDIKMPEMDGIEALEKIISSQRGLPVIIHSAYSHFKENYLTWSAASYVVKSGNLTDLIQEVEKCIKNKEAN